MEDEGGNNIVKHVKGGRKSVSNFYRHPFCRVAEPKLGESSSLQPSTRMNLQIRGDISEKPTPSNVLVIRTFNYCFELRDELRMSARSVCVEKMHGKFSAAPRRTISG